LELDCDDTTSDHFAGHLDGVLGGQLVGQPETLPVAVASETVRSSRAEQAEIPLLLTPRNTYITETQPTFNWQPVPDASGYRLSLNLANGESWSRETTETNLIYPDDAPPLAPGSANVVYLAALDNETVVDKTLLQVVAEPERKALTEAEEAIQALNLTETAENYLLARLYRRYQMWSAAMDQLQHLTTLESAPSASLYQQLGDLYMEVGLYLQAEANYQAALAAAETAGDQASRAAAHVGLARTAELFEEFEAVLDHLNMAETLYRQAGQTEQAEAVAAEKAELEK
jgi:tetratricopeptide (TPR) repeat protein